MKKLIFSSEDLASELSDRARFNRWREIFAWRYGSAEISRLADRPFKARSEFLQLGTLGLVRSETTVQRFRRTLHQAADGAGGYLVAFNNGLSCTAVDQNGNMEVYSPNQIWLGSMADALDVQSKTGTKWVAVAVPPSKLLEVLPNADELVAKPIDATRPADALSAALYRVSADGRRDWRRQRLKQPFGRHAPRSRRAFSRRQRGHCGNGRDARTPAPRASAKFSCVSKRVSQVSIFSAESIAQALSLLGALCAGIAAGDRNELPRTSSRIAPAEGPQDARPIRFHDTLKISDIAYACGFNEVSYFNRCFRRRFGASPTQFTAC